MNCNCSMFCCTLLYVHSSIAIILMGKRKLVALLYVFLVSRDGRVTLSRGAMGCLPFVIVVFPDHTHLLFLSDFCSGLVALGPFYTKCEVN